MRTSYEGPQIIDFLVFILILAPGSGPQDPAFSRSRHLDPLLGSLVRIPDEDLLLGAPDHRFLRVYQYSSS